LKCRSVKRTNAVIIIAAYIMAGALLEVSHLDHVVASFVADPVVTSHECGNKEIHNPLNHVHRCPACMQSTHRLSTEAAKFLIVNNTLLCLATATESRDKLLAADILHSGKRGPPPASL
jgi:hypothetical protein